MFILFGPQPKVCFEFWPEVHLSFTPLFLSIFCVACIDLVSLFLISYCNIHAPLQFFSCICCLCVFTCTCVYMCTSSWKRFCRFFRALRWFCLSSCSIWSPGGWKYPIRSRKLRRTVSIGRSGDKLFPFFHRASRPLNIKNTTSVTALLIQVFSYCFWFSHPL